MPCLLLISFVNSIYRLIITESKRVEDNFFSPHYLKGKLEPYEEWFAFHITGLSFGSIKCYAFQNGIMTSNINLGNYSDYAVGWVGQVLLIFLISKFKK